MKIKISYDPEDLEELQITFELLKMLDRFFPSFLFPSRRFWWNPNKIDSKGNTHIYLNSRYQEKEIRGGSGSAVVPEGEKAND